MTPSRTESPELSTGGCDKQAPSIVHSPQRCSPEPRLPNEEAGSQEPRLTACAEAHRPLTRPQRQEPELAATGRETGTPGAFSSLIRGASPWAVLPASPTLPSALCTLHSALCTTHPPSAPRASPGAPSPPGRRSP